MANKDVIWVDGERELFLNMEKQTRGTIQAAMQGLQSAALNIIADAKENLRGNHSVVTGQLRASGKVQKVEGDEQALDAGFFSEGNGYAAYVEYGTKGSTKRKLGWMIRLIKQWLRKKGMPEGKELNDASFFISRKIIRKGTKPHPFFAPAVEKNKQQVNDAISMAIQQEIK